MPARPSDPMTAPLELPAISVRIKELAAPAAIATGVATKYWLELRAYPPGSARSLWLHVGGAWRHLDDPNDGTQISVQDAFSAGADHLEVAVWYSGTIIVGLVVRSK
jgi:hypothetical protein